MKHIRILENRIVQLEKGKLRAAPTVSEKMEPGEDEKGQWGLSGDTMLTLERIKPHCGNSQAVGQDPQGCAGSVLRRLPRPDWMKPWLSPASSHVLDLRPLSSRGSSSIPHTGSMVQLRHLRMSLLSHTKPWFMFRPRYDLLCLVLSPLQNLPFL